MGMKESLVEEEVVKRTENALLQMAGLGLVGEEVGMKVGLGLVAEEGMEMMMEMGQVVEVVQREKNV